MLTLLEKRRIRPRFHAVSRVPPPSIAPTPVEIAVAGCWLGMAVGLIELGWILSSRWLIGRITHETLGTNWHFGWMIPVSNVGLFGAIGLLLGIASWPLPGSWRARVAAHVYGFLGAVVLAMGMPGLHQFAIIALAAGLSMRLAPWIASRQEGFRRVIGRTLPAAAGIVLILTAWQWTRVSWAEARSIAGSPIPPGSPPNVILIVLDTLRADAMSLHGSTRETTPEIDRLARGMVRFDAARSTAPWTLPSHAGMFTGRYGHDLAVDAGRAMDSDVPTLAGYLASRGYATAGFVANTHNCNAWYGLSRGFARYEDQYENTAVNLVELLRASRLGHAILMSKTGQRMIKSVMTTPRYRYRKSAAMINRDALTWLSHPRDRPFFLFLNYYDVHDPYEPPPGFPRRFSDIAAASAGGPPRDILGLARDLYDDSLSYLDDQIGRLFEELEARGLLENSVVILTSDHGESFGEHGLAGHGISLYRPELHVPLLVGGSPRVSIPEGRAVTVPVSLRDIPATIVDLAGIADGSPFPGRSLRRYWTSDAPETTPHDPIFSEVRSAPPNVPNPSRVPATRGLMRSVVDRDFVYIVNGDRREELYDRRVDPGETRDLAGMPASAPDLGRLRDLLRAETQKK